jgi:hypothetical protein
VPQKRRHVNRPGPNVAGFQSMTQETKPWNPSTGTRVLIGLATLWPLVYFGFFMASIGLSFWLRDATRADRGVDFLKYIFPLHCFTMLVSFALMAIYVVHAFRSPHLRQDTRILWVIILFMGNLFAFPVYWWLYLRPSSRLPTGPTNPSDDSASANSSGALSSNEERPASDGS